MPSREEFMQQAIHMARLGMTKNEGGPFGCVIVSKGQIIGKGHNSVLAAHDPTAHAEIMAIREACRELRSFQLTGCELYTTCEPCPMCMGAIYWSRPDRVYYANTRFDAAAAGFDDSFIYEELSVQLNARKIEMISLGRAGALTLFREWQEKSDRTAY